MSFLDPVLNPLLNLQPIWVIIIISLSITVIMTFIYKLLTNQTLMKSLKDEMKHLQKEVKEYSKHPEKLAAAQKKIMSKNMEYMKHSMKPTLVTMIPILLIIGWLSSHLSFYPLVPGMAFDVNVTADLEELTIEAKNLTIIGNTTQFSETGEFSWKAKAAEKGEYIIGFSSGDSYAEKKIIISDRQEYAQPVEKVSNSKITYITIGNKKLRPLGDFSIFGWRPSWLGVYIIISLVASLLLRKALKIH